MDAPTLTPSAHFQLHLAMSRIRRVEERIAAAYADQEMRCPTHFCIGQEAPPVGVSAHLRRDDLAFSGHRSHGHYLAKGGDLRAMLAELHGRVDGCAAGRGGSQHLIDLEAGFVASAPILAGTVPIAVGAAWAAQRRGEDRVSVVYFGDGATEEGSFHEALNYAGVHRLPVIFVCENNLYSVHSAMDVRQPDRPVADLGPAHGMPGAHIDGDDVAAVWSAAAAAVARARSGGGPTLIECMTYRWLEHCGPNEDDQLGYRAADEVAAFREKDPLRRSEAALRASGVWDAEAADRAAAAVETEIDAAFAFAKASPHPDPATLAAFVYPRRADAEGAR